MSEPKQATAFAPASTSNLAVGFDLLGHALEEPGDRITVRRIPRPEVRIERILGCTTELPLDPTTNTATVGLIRMIDDLGLDFGFELEISKGIPLGSGIGGSAASAVAAVTAANALLPMPLDESELFHYALVGEMIASGAAHGDNLAPALFGGLVLVRGLEPLEIVRVPVPEPWRCTIVRPHLRIDTRRAREVLPESVSLETQTRQAANLAGFIAGCYEGDPDIVRGSLQDLIIEPHRAHLIPGFVEAQRAALEAGALGASISGAGPSLFAWSVDDGVATEIAGAMVKAFAERGLEADQWVSPIMARGAHLLEVE